MEINIPTGSYPICNKCNKGTLLPCFIKIEEYEKEKEIRIGWECSNCGHSVG